MHSIHTHTSTRSCLGVKEHMGCGELSTPDRSEMVPVRLACDNRTIKRIDSDFLFLEGSTHIRHNALAEAVTSLRHATMIGLSPEMHNVA